MAGYVARIEEQASRYGAGTLITASALDEECERELEQEEEEEEEVELQVAKQAPRAEADWDVAAALACGLAGVRAAQPGLMRLSEAVTRHLKQAKAAGSIVWDAAGGSVWLTPGFMLTLEKAEEDDLSLYLRQVDSIVALPSDKALILLSDREADALLAAEWAGASHSRRNLLPSKLLHLSYVRSEHARLMDRRPQRAALSEAALGRAQLFNGETMFCAAEKAALKEALGTQSARSAALALPALRGLEKNLPESDLAQLCEED